MPSASSALRTRKPTAPARFSTLLRQLKDAVPEAVAWLLDEEAAARAQWSASELTGLLQDLFTAAEGCLSDAGTSRVLDLVRRYSDVLPGRATADLLATLPLDVTDAGVRDVVRRVLERQPHHAGLLRVACEGAIRSGDGAAAHDLLTRLARADDDLATVRHVHRVRATVPAAGGPTARIALLSSFTVDFLVPYVDLECRALGLTPQIYVTPFNSWTQEVLAEASELRRFDPEIAFLAVSIDDLVPALAGAPPAADLEQAGDAALERVLSVARAFTTWSGAVLVVHGFHSAYTDPLGVLGGRSPSGRGRWLAELNARLSDGLRDLPRTFLLDVQDVLVRRAGGGPHDNPKMRHYASLRLGDRVLGEMARCYARYIAPLKGLTRKCVVVDLDNTLWGGVVGEDGPRGIQLGDTAPGVEYQDFQRYLAALSARGILLAVNSKNNPDDALEIIRSHEGMVLREDAFSAVRVNWRPKPENMVSIAEELNIGLDALVFLDDSPEERALMRESLPQVLTPELPTDPALYRQTVEALPQLQTLVVTETDQTRVEQYRARRQREQARDGAASLEEFLHSLEITVEIARADDSTLPRVHQLFQRTNQFNLTTRRHELDQLAAWARDPGWRLYTVRSRDRFGDHGLVAVGLVRLDRGAWVIDSFVMSCRVISYGVETALLATVCEAAAAAGAGAVIGEFVETRKNLPARDFYARHGFTADGGADGVTRWTRSLADGAVRRPPWVALVVADGA